MKLEDQVCSLELSKRLKELGVKQDAHFWWNTATEPETLWCINALENLHKDMVVREAQNHFSFAAFTTGELGEMLPARIRRGKYAEYLDCFKRNNQRWHCCYIKSEPKDIPIITRDIPYMASADTEANARAGLLIYLLENNLITI